jgi:hypothetical protein
MLPINIIANWCSAEAPPDHVWGVLHDGLRQHEPRRASHAVSRSFSWTETTRMSFGGSDWYQIEGTLDMEGRRAVLCRPHPEDEGRTHIVLVALLPTSLVHLKNSVGSFVRDELRVQLQDVELSLSDVAKGCFDLDPHLVSAFDTTGAYAKHSFSMERAEQLQQEAGISLERRIRALLEERGPSVTELRLRLDPFGSEVAAARDGMLTFNNPETTLDEIDNVLSIIDRASRTRPRGGSENFAVGRNDLSNYG